MVSTEPTTLERALAERLAARPGLCGIHALREAHDAFAARMWMARAAERTLDVQYYIWRGDMTGILLLRELAEAAARGVRVRLLLDDNNTRGLDAMLGALDLHPNVEVRLFNATRFRRARLLGLLLHPSRANRRMHNKSFTADDALTVIGGRNVGDEYFGAGSGLLFDDLDVAVVGPAVADVSSAFEAYWTSACVEPLGAVVAPADGDAFDDLLDRAATTAQKEAADQYVCAVRESDFMIALVEGRLELEWAPARLVVDDPRKGLGHAASRDVLTARLQDLIGRPRATFDLVSAYFVPTRDGTRRLTALADGGVAIRVLTNSLDATDVTAVHAGYAKRRRALLEAGVRLFELRRTAPRLARRERRRSSRLGSSSSSLHAKTFAVDGEKVFVGSFNFDPRSARLNTELGIVIESASLAGAVRETFDDEVAETAYEVVLAGNGRMLWCEVVDGRFVRHGHEPDASAWRRALVMVLSFLPIEWML